MEMAWKRDLRKAKVQMASYYLTNQLVSVQYSFESVFNLYRAYHCDKLF